ncbi:MAG: HAD family hydrolase [Opitutales bacterium]|nr:HAD family hydrolase [Opitutales bacterium]
MLPPPPPATIFFDLDGTLIDNFTAIHKCYADVARELGKEPQSYAALRAAVGGSIHLTMSRMIGDHLADEGAARFRRHFKDVMFEGVFALPGVDWILPKLRAAGYKVGVWTNKDYDATVALLGHLKLDSFFDYVFGTNLPDMPWRKPDRKYAEYVFEKSGTGPQNAMLIGDSPFDVATAKNVGMAFACVVTGTHDRAPLVEAAGTPEVVFEDIFDLGKIFKI